VSAECLSTRFFKGLCWSAVLLAFTASSAYHVRGKDLRTPIQRTPLRHSFTPKEGFVPNEATAIRIAEAVWEPIYGRDDLQRHLPTRAVLTDGVWTVRGTLPPGVWGGTAVAEIRKKDGCILRVSHGK